MFLFVARAAGSLESPALCISFRCKMWDMILNGVQASSLLDSLFRKIDTSIPFLFSTGLLAIPLIELVLPTIHSILSWRWLSVVQLASL